MPLILEDNSHGFGCELDVRTMNKVYGFVKKNFEQVFYVNALIEDQKSEICYSKMQGRPSVTVEIQGKQWECLLDTGAGVNVMSKKYYQDLNNLVLEKCDINLRGANDGKLKVLGKIEVEVDICQTRKAVPFIVVESVVPELIGGIVFMKIFGYSIQRNESQDNNVSREARGSVCNIEAKFGRVIRPGERLKRALDCIGKVDSKLLEVIQNQAEVFMADKWDIGCTSLAKHHIKTNGEPINLKPFRQPMHLEEKIMETIKNLYDNNIIRKCNSPWNTPLICVWKKEKKDIRICLDFRRLNAITERQAFPMPNVDEMLDALGGAKYFSSIDLGNAYYQVELDEESQEKTAFSTKQGQYCFTRMPFGIAAAPGTFQEMMTKVVGGIKGATVYLDDILVYTKDREQHYIVLNQVLDNIRKAGLRVNPEKCQLLKREIKFLGHIVNEDGVKTDPSKIEAIRTFGKPKCVKNLRSFLGICNYYRRFIKEYAKKARVLEQLCGSNNNKKLNWTSELELAFEEMKNALITSPVLCFPDMKRDFILDTDASFDTIGAVLAQKDDQGKERVVAYGSRSMNSHEKGYCVTRKELLAMYYFCNHFRHFLYGKRFTLRTDHKAITFMLNTKKPITSQFQTWINYLSSLDMKLEFRKGSLHTNADMLSRMNCDTCTQCLMQHEEAKKEKIKTRALDVVSEDETTKPLEDIIWETHRMLAHAGARKVEYYLRDSKDFDKLKGKIKEIGRSCESCLKYKTYTAKTKENSIKLEAAEVFECIYVDICGPLKETSGKKKYILGIIDQFSKYITLLAISKQDEESIIKGIMRNWILKFGSPKAMNVDCGKVFESKKMKEFAEKQNFEIRFSSPYHHNTNGQIERQFRTVRELINATLHERRSSDWAEILPEIEFSLNATLQTTIGMSPAEIIFGRRISREKWDGKNSKTFQYERDQEPITRRQFFPGDDVLVKVESRTKDQGRYDGPYKVVRKVHDRRYVLEDMSGKTCERNVEKIKKFLRAGV